MTSTDREVRAHRRKIQRHVLYVIAMASVVVFALLTIRVLLGTYTVTPADFFRVLRGADMPPTSFIVMESKLPRAVGALVIGASLGIAGMLYQLMMRNTLASPDILGITMGASTGAVIAVVWLGSTGNAIGWSAAAGALTVSIAVNILGRHSTNRMVLIGVAMAAGLTALTNWLLLQTDTFRAHDALRWLIGSVSSTTWDEIVRVSIVLALCAPIALWLHSQLVVAEMGDDLAQSLGVNLPRIRFITALVVVTLVSSAASVGGPVAFISLLAGPIARSLLGGRSSVILAAAVGSATLVMADHLAANALPGVTVPAGVVTGLVGGPFLLWLIVSMNSSPHLGLTHRVYALIRKVAP